MIAFKKVQAIPLGKVPAKVLIRWQTNVKNDAELKDYEFCVLRQVQGEDGRPNFQDVDIDGNLKTPVLEALSPVSLEPISVWIDGLDFPWYIDFSETLKNLTHQSNYKVQCRNKITQESVLSDPFTWEGQLDLVGLYVVDEHNFLLKDVVGVPSLVYQRRRGGVQCTCVDPIQKKRLSSFCTKCYGTNWIKGFFDPIDSYIDYSPNPKNAAIANWGEITDNDSNAIVSNFPNLSPGDVIRELRDNRMWRVVNVTVTEKRRCQMLQFARLTEIKAGDVEYAIPNDERFQVRKMEEFEAIKHKREF